MKLKNNYQRIYFAAAYFLLLCLSACYESRFPLDPTPQAPIDTSLLASWRCLPADPDTDSTAATLTINMAREGVYTSVFQADDEQPETYETHTSLVKGQPLLNIRDGGEPATWVFGRYLLLLPNVLQIQIVDADGLEGMYETPADLRQALEQQLDNPKLFSDLMTCVRIKNEA